MSQVKTHATEVQKRTEPAHHLKQEAIRQPEQGPVQQVAPQAAYRRGQVISNGLRPADLLALQRTVGNRTARHIVRGDAISIVQIQAKKSGKALTTANQPLVHQLQTALSQIPPDFMSVAPPPMVGGGAYFLLNGLNPTHLINTLKALNRTHLNMLASNLQAAEGLYDRPRLELAIKASRALPKPEYGMKAVSMLDEIRRVGQGSFDTVFKQIQDLPKPTVQTILGLLDLETLLLIRSHIGAAPAKSKGALTKAANVIVPRTLAQKIQEALTMEPPDFQSSPKLTLPLRSPAPYGGAYYLLDGLTPVDMINTLNALNKAQLRLLASNLELAEGLYDRQRLELAIKATLTQVKPEHGILAMSILDEIRKTGGAFGAVFNQVGSLRKATVQAIIGLFDLKTLLMIRAHINDAPVAIREALAKVVNRSVHLTLAQQIQDLLLDKTAALVFLNGLGIVDTMATLTVLENRSTGVINDLHTHLTTTKGIPVNVERLNIAFRIVKFGGEGAPDLTMLGANVMSETEKKEVEHFGSFQLGTLSAPYESGGDPSVISGGVGDAGGQSYGMYQMIAANVKLFVKQYYPKEFEGLEPKTASFNKKWKEIADKDLSMFAKNQHEFIKTTHYDPAVQKVNIQLTPLFTSGFDVNKRTLALRRVLWSTAVQHGSEGAASIFKIAVEKAQKAAGPTNKNSITDQDIIKEIYAERGRETNGVLVRFATSSAEVQAGVKARYGSEKGQALKDVEREGRYGSR